MGPPYPYRIQAWRRSTTLSGFLNSLEPKRLGEGAHWLLEVAEEGDAVPASDQGHHAPLSQTVLPQATRYVVPPDRRSSDHAGQGQRSFRRVGGASSLWPGLLLLNEAEDHSASFGGQTELVKPFRPSLIATSVPSADAASRGSDFQSVAAPSRSQEKNQTNRASMLLDRGTAFCTRPRCGALRFGVPTKEVPMTRVDVNSVILERIKKLLKMTEKDGCT